MRSRRGTWAASEHSSTPPRPAPCTPARRIRLSTSTPSPRLFSAYGHVKLQQERAVTRWTDETATPSLIGRIANLYGPGQQLAKAQGLVSQLCWTQLVQSQLGIYVSLSTMRDYLFAPDCARMIAAGLDSIADGPARSTVKVLASQRPLSVGAVLAEFRRVLRRNPRISLRSSAESPKHVRDLRLRSAMMTAIDQYAATPFPVGLHATYHDLRQRFAAASA